MMQQVLHVKLPQCNTLTELVDVILRGSFLENSSGC